MNQKEIPLISVILPLYNEPLNQAKESIESICKQTYRRLEILLLLDNPQNEPLKKLMMDYQNSDPRVKCVFNEQNIGLPATLNKGINEANGAYIARMDGDDISLPERLEKQLDFLISHPNVDLVGCDAFAIDENGIKIGYYSKMKNNYSLKKMLEHCSTSLIHPTWLGKKELFERCLYRNFFRSQDYDFMLRADALKATFHNLKEPLFKYRIPQKSLRSISCKYAYEQYINAMLARKQFYAFKKTGKYPDLPEFNYDETDKMRYLRTVPLLNELRNNWFNHNIFRCFMLFVRIWKIDSRPIKLRIKSVTLGKVLRIADFFSR